MTEAAVGEGARVAEVRASTGFPFWNHPGWGERFPWLVQGTTGAGEDGESFDLGLFGAQPVGEVMARWRTLREEADARLAVHARQVHGAGIAVHRPEPAEGAGLCVLEGVDGHLTDRPDVLLTVSVADCVPVFLVDPERRAVGLLHAGWRGAAASILERGVERMRAEFGSRPAALHAHAGPAICGGCYEVSAEVHAAVNPYAPAPPAPTPIDLRAALLARARRLGIPGEHLSLSAHCTRCGPGAFFSHRGGSPGRQVGVIGILPGESGG